MFIWQIKIEFIEIKNHFDLHQIDQLISKHLPKKCHDTSGVHIWGDITKTHIIYDNNKSLYIKLCVNDDSKESKELIINLANFLDSSLKIEDKTFQANMEKLDLYIRLSDSFNRPPDRDRWYRWSLFHYIPLFITAFSFTEPIYMIRFFYEYGTFPILTETKTIMLYIDIFLVFFILIYILWFFSNFPATIKGDFLIINQAPLKRVKIPLSSIIKTKIDKTFYISYKDRSGIKRDCYIPIAKMDFDKLENDIEEIKGNKELGIKF